MSILFEENMSAGCSGIETLKTYLINAYKGKQKSENEVKRLVNTCKKLGVKVVEPQGDHALDAKCSNNSLPLNREVECGIEVFFGSIGFYHFCKNKTTKIRRSDP